MNKVIQAIVLLVGGVTTLSPLVGQTPPGDGPLWTKTLEHEIRWLMPAPFGLVIVATKDELQVVEGGTGELAWQLEEKELERGRVFIILDNVLIASDNEVDLPGYSTLRAYRLLDGRERWVNKRTIIGQVMKIVPDYKRGAAVVVSSGDQLRRAKPHTYVSSINLQDGSGTWGRRLEKDAKLHDGRLAGYHRPLLRDDDLYVPYGGLQTIDAVTGETRWFQKYGVLEDDLPFSEADLIVGDDVVYATGRGRVRAFERTTGRRLWETRDYGVVSQLHLRGSTLIAGTGGQFLKPGGKGGFFRSLVTVGADVYGAEWLGEALETTDILLGKRGRLQTATKEPVGLVAFDAPTGTVLWQYRLAKGGVSNVIEVGNTLFIADEQHLIGLNSATGTPAYSTPIAFVVPPVAIRQEGDHHLTILSEWQMVGFDLEANREAYNVVLGLPKVPVWKRVAAAALFVGALRASQLIDDQADRLYEEGIICEGDLEGDLGDMFNPFRLVGGLFACPPPLDVVLAGIGVAMFEVAALGAADLVVRQLTVPGHTAQGTTARLEFHLSHADEETLTLVGRDFRTGDVVWKGTLGDEAPDSIAIDEAMDLVYVLQGSRFSAFRPHLDMPPPPTLNPWQ